MATPNFTGDGGQEPTEQLYCSGDVTAGIHDQLTYISVFNIFLSITSFLGNALILAALHKESSLHPPSKLLLCSLATTDLCVGLITEPLSITYWMSLVNENWDVCRYVSIAGFVTNTILCSVSLLTLTAISVDRLLALLLGLRYKHVVTLKRTYAIVITFWVASTAVSMMHLWYFFITHWYGTIVTTLCLVTSIFSYTKIFLTLRHRQNQVQDNAQQPNQANQLNIARYRKAVYTALWLQLTLVACYLPIGVMAGFATDSELSTSVFLANQLTATIAFSNSSLNPILYSWKIYEVRQAVKDTIKRLLCCLSI